MENRLDGSWNPYLVKYKFKRKLDANFFKLIDSKFPNKDVCYFCLTLKHESASVGCGTFCKEQIIYRSQHRVIRDHILVRDNYTCQQCGVEQKHLDTALKLLKKANKKLWRLKREELHIPDKRIITLMDVDHVIPIKDGGGCGMIGDIRNNLRCLCLYCHFYKDNHVKAPKSNKSQTKDRKVL